MNQSNLQVLEFSTTTTLTQAAATEVVQRAKAAITDRGIFSIALAGGSTPKSLYTLLTTEAWSHHILWSKVHLFWGDERHVPPDHPDSNYRMVQESLINKVPIPPENVHRIKAEGANAEQVAIDYEQTLQRFFELSKGELPKFDLILLGMGADGHTASLFPGTDALHEQQQLVRSNWVEKLNTASSGDARSASRITLTAPVLNHAKGVLFFVSGAEKAEALQAVLHGDYQPDRYPSQLIAPVHGDLLWMIDRAAARLLNGTQFDLSLR